MSRFVVWLFPCLILLTAARAGSDETVPAVVFPAIPAQAQTQAELVPKGWIVEMESRGDLNGDGVPDLMLVLHMNNPGNVIKNDGFGVSELDTNPRMLVVAFVDKATKKYSLALANHTLIPRQTNPLMDDHLGNAEIVKGTLRVSLGMWMSAGSWYTTQTKLTFRYQDGCFKLIGYDSTETKRNTGETSEVSINYLTKKVKIAKGNIENDHRDVSWKTLRAPRLLCLDAVGDGLDFDPES